MKLKKSLFYLTLLAGSGLFFGIFAYIVLPDEQVLILQQYLTSQIQELAISISQAEINNRIFHVHAMDLLRIYLAGLCLLGFPLLFLFLFVKMFILGFTSCFLAQYSLLLLFAQLLQLPLLILAIAIGCHFTRLLLQNRLNNFVRQWLHYTICFSLLLFGFFLFSYLEGWSCSRYLYHFSGLF